MHLVDRCIGKCNHVNEKVAHYQHWIDCRDISSADLCQTSTQPSNNKFFFLLLDDFLLLWMKVQMCRTSSLIVSIFTEFNSDRKIPFCIILKYLWYIWEVPLLHTDIS